MSKDNLLVSLGAVLGANARYWVGDWLTKRWGSAFPHGTLVINSTGSLLPGSFMTLITERFLGDPRWRTASAIDVLGAYTTFSTHTYESATLMLNGYRSLGLSNLLGSALLGAVVVGLGVLLGRLT